MVRRYLDVRGAPGRCVVRVVSGPGGIARADAVIVADEGETLFRRCLIEEVLQGLGPLNDDARLKQWASQTLPSLEEHLRQAQQLQRGTQG